VLAGLALGAAIAIAGSFGDDDEQRRTEELARLAPSTDDDASAGVTASGDGQRAGDVSMIARTLNENVSEVDAP
jgi:hypothetical protein